MKRVITAIVILSLLFSGTVCAMEGDASYLSSEKELEEEAVDWILNAYRNLAMRRSSTEDWVGYDDLFGQSLLDGSLPSIRDQESSDPYYSSRCHFIEIFGGGDYAIYIARYDMNKDGTEELIIGYNSDDKSDDDATVLWAAYSVKKGIIQTIFHGWSRSHYFLAEDGSIIHYGDSSAFNKEIVKYDLIEDANGEYSLKEKEAVVIDGNKYPDKPYFYYPDGREVVGYNDYGEPEYSTDNVIQLDEESGKFFYDRIASEGIHIELERVDLISDSSEEKLLNMIEELSGSEIIKYWYDDFDMDGKKEVFAAVETVEGLESEPYNASIWFASNVEVVCLPLENKWGYSDFFVNYNGSEIFTINSSQKIFVTGYGVPDDVISFCAYVKDGIAIRVKDVEGYLCQQSGKEFYIDVLNGDLLTETDDEVGNAETFRRYYLEWTGEGFSEYVGKEISREELERYDGASQILQQAADEGYSIGTILKRDNGIINVNLFKNIVVHNTYHAVENQNLTLKCRDDNSVDLVVFNKDSVEWIYKYSRGGAYEVGARKERNR